MHRAWYLLLPAVLLAACDDSGTLPETSDVLAGPLLPLPTEEPVVRVRLEAFGTRSQPRSIGADGQPLTIHGGGAESVWDGPVRVARGADGWIVGGRGGPLPAASAKAAAIDIEPDAGTASALPDDEGTSSLYPGTIRAVTSDPDEWLVLNIVPMEQYLPGVLQAELFDGWPEATYEAQAIAARSFAAMQVAQRMAHDWDVTDTASTQAYMGDASDETAIRAAQATRGKVLSFDGGLVPGYFCSCCGGLPATGVEAVGPNPLNAQSPLQGHKAPIRCEGAPVYTWTRTVSPADVGAALRTWGKGQRDESLSKIGDIESIASADTNAHGRSTRLRVVDQNGRRALIDAVDMSSALFDLDGGPPMSGWFTASREGDQLKLEGRGFGHGAGLCQYGAADMGERGQTAEEIIQFYYPGATISTAW